MKNIRALFVIAAGVSALLLSGCAGDNMFGGTTTAALPEKPKVDPVCVSLASQIDALRKEGVADRVAAASQGKSTTVNMKRESLAKVAELNKANADFQSKCGTVAPSTSMQPIAVPPATAKAVSSSTPAKAVTKTAAAAVPKAPATPAAAETVAKQATEAVKPKTE